MEIDADDEDHSFKPFSMLGDAPIIENKRPAPFDSVHSTTPEITKRRKYELV
jgi:hypothetical protein